MSKYYDWSFVNIEPVLGHSIVLVSNNVIVLEQVHKPVFPDAPFCFMIERNGHWRPVKRYWESKELAYIDAVAYLKLGSDNKLTVYVEKMLRVD